MGNLEMMLEPTLEQVRADLTDTEFWLLVEPGEASEVHWWEHSCWKCSASFVVWLMRTTPPWSYARPEQEPSVIAAVLSDAEPRTLGYLDWRETRPVPTGYMAFCCPFCHATSGDWFLHEEFKSLLPGGTNIVSVSL